MVLWGLIGASDIATTRTIPAIRSSGGTVQAVMSGSAQHAAAFAAKHRIGFQTTDLDNLLGQDVQAVYISSNNETHFDQTQLALRAGKHVMCKKPIALNTDEAAAMVRLAADLGLVLAVNHHLPGNSLNRKVRQIVASGTIGDVLAAQVSYAGLLPARLRGCAVPSQRQGPASYWT